MSGSTAGAVAIQGNLEPWQKAVEVFKRELTDQEKAVFTHARPEDILKDVNAQEQAQQKASRTRLLLTKIQPWLNTVNEYGKALDVLANSSSVLPPLWGCLRVLLTVVHKYNDYYAKIIDTLERIGDHLPRYATFAQLLQFHAPLQNALQEAYIGMTMFFIQAKRMLSKSSVRMLFRIPLKSFDSDFAECVAQMRRFTEFVQAEAHTASIILQVRETEKAELERSQAEETRKQVSRLESLTDERRRADTMLWLNARNCHDEKDSLVDTRVAATCDWILQNKNTSEWLTCPDIPLLWISGPPGCGKSYLYGRLLEYLESQNTTLYFLFCGGDKERTTISSLLRSWSCQLINHFPQLLPHLEILKNGKNNPVATDNEILALFRLLIGNAPETIYLTVDALDEADDGAEFFRKIAPTLPKQFKLLVTSRTPANARKDLTSVQIPLRTVEIEPRTSLSDIRKFVDIRLQTANLSCTADTLMMVRKRLATSEGMFLWVSLMLDHLAAQTCEREVLLCLLQLPQGLSDTYDRILRQINTLPVSRRLLAHKTFFWALTVRRPVSVEEMRVLLAVQPTSPNFDEMRLMSDVDCEPLILAVSYGLLQLRGPAKKIYFSHFTITEYLRKCILGSSIFQEVMDHYDTSSFRTNDALAAAVCMQYLCYNIFGAHLPPSNIEDATRILDTQDRRYALLAYAVSQWFKHFKSGEACISLLTQFALQFSDATKGNLEFCWRIYWFSAPDASTSLICPSAFSALHISAYFGLGNVVSHLLPSNPPPILDSLGRSPLWWAASRGLSEISRALIEAGFDPDELDKYSVAPVHRAAANGHTEVLEAILNVATPTTSTVTDSEGWTPLHWGASRGQASAVKLLLQHYESRGRYGTLAHCCYRGRNALHLAALNGHSAVLVELITRLCTHDELNWKYAVDEINIGMVPPLDLQDTEGLTPLHLAALQGHLESVKILLNGGANYAIRDTSGKSAADKARLMGNDSVCEILEAVAQFHEQRRVQPYHNQMNYLRSRTKMFAKLELDPFAFGADDRLSDQDRKQLNSLDTHDASVLHAIINNHKGSLRLFMGKGRDIPDRDHRGRTLFHYAAALGYDRVVKEWLDTLERLESEPWYEARYKKRFDGFLDRQDDRGWTALHYAATGGFAEICTMLLASGASAMIENKDSLTAYGAAVREGDQDAIEAIGRCARMPSAQIASDFHWEALHIHARDDTLFEEHLLDLSPEQLQIKDRFGRTPLYRAAEMGKTRTVKLLLGHMKPCTDETLALAIVAEKFHGDGDLMLTCLHQLDGRSLKPHPSHQIMAQHLLVKAIERNDLEAVKVLYNAGVSLINCRLYAERTAEAEGVSALVIAIGYEAVAVANFFIQNGGDVHETSPDGEPLLQFAASMDLATVVDSLLEHGANTTQELNAALTESITRFADSEQAPSALLIARSLLEHGASLLSTNENNEYNAWLVIEKYSPGRGIQWSEIEQLFLDFGCAVLAHEPDEYGYMAIHQAIMNGDTPRLRCELDAGVPVDFPSVRSNKWTPLCFAVYYEAWEAVQVLLEYGVNVADVLEEERFPVGFKEVADERTEFLNWVATYSQSIARHER